MLKLSVMIWSDTIINSTNFDGDIEKHQDILNWENKNKSSISTVFIASSEQNAIDIIDAFHNETNIKVHHHFLNRLQNTTKG